MWEAPIYLVSNLVSAKTWSPGCFDPPTSGCKDCKFLSKNRHQSEENEKWQLNRSRLSRYQFKYQTPRYRKSELWGCCWILNRKYLVRSCDWYLVPLCFVRLRWEQCENLQHICIGIYKPLNLSPACSLVLHSLQFCTPLCRKSAQAKLCVHLVWDFLSSVWEIWSPTK